MRVGRAALDEDAIRLIEQHHPDVDFDWVEILKGPLEVGATPKEPDREVRRPEAPKKRKAEGRPRTPEPQESSAHEPARAGAADVGPAEPGALAVDEEEVLVPEMPPAEPPTVHAAAEIRISEPASAALTRLGAEMLQRLRGRYAELLARITEKIPDPVRAEELKALAERLNPDTWVTEAEVTAALEQYEAVFSSLRSVVGRRRKRRRRRGGPSRAENATGTVQNEPSPGGEPDEDGMDEPDPGDPDL